MIPNPWQVFVGGGIEEGGPGSIPEPAILP